MSGTFVVLLLIYGTLWIPGTGYLLKKMSQCSFSDNKQGNITFDSFFTVNRQIVIVYNKMNDRYEACPQGVEEMETVADKFADLLNSNPDTVTLVKEEEKHCKEEVKMFWDKTVERKVKPSVEVFLPSVLHTEGLPILVCQVWGFYPQNINVAWFKNDKLVKNYTEAMRAGDWTYSIVATLDMRDTHPEDNYTCLVDHSSLGGMPIAKNWKHGLTNIQIIKVSVASVVLALGLVCLITGIACWKNAKRSEVLILLEGSVTNASTSPLLPIPSQPLEEEDSDLGEESETHSVQGELSVGEISSLCSWGASSVPFYQGCALKDGDEEQANDRYFVPI